jgi:hypothetical protein
LDHKHCTDVARLQLRVLDLLPDNENSLFQLPGNDATLLSGSLNQSFDEQNSVLQVPVGTAALPLCS